MSEEKVMVTSVSSETVKAIKKLEKELQDLRTVFAKAEAKLKKDIEELYAQYKTRFVELSIAVAEDHLL